jgi:hypothetical protein
VSASTDTASTDQLTSQLDLTGYFESAINGTDYVYRYRDDHSVEVEFKTSGGFKVNY